MKNMICAFSGCTIFTTQLECPLDDFSLEKPQILGGGDLQPLGVGMLKIRTIIFILRLTLSKFSLYLIEY